LLSPEGTRGNGRLSHLIVAPNEAIPTIITAIIATSEKKTFGYPGMRVSRVIQKGLALALNLNYRARFCRTIGDLCPSTVLG
jgi:hypothetical protein